VAPAFYEHNGIRLYQGHVLDVLKQLPDESVQCCITSPPYFALRDYGNVPQVWGDGDLSSLGLEKTPEQYIGHLVEAFREVRRGLRSDGTLWLNCGDSYASTPPGNKTLGVSASSTLHGVDSKRYRETLAHSVQQKRNTISPGLKPKDLIGVPWMLAFALRSDGWWLRSEIIWHKPNPMPESVTDRPTKAHEQVFLLAKSAAYYYDAEAIKEPQSEGTHERFGKNPTPSTKRKLAEPGNGVKNNSSFDAAMRTMILPNGRNRRSVWTIPTEAYPQAHFATFPRALVEPCILAGSSARGACARCGSPWERVVESEHPGDRGKTVSTYESKGVLNRRIHPGEHPTAQRRTVGWHSTCTCNCDEVVPCVILDPFAGSGTTLQVAQDLGRHAIGIELNPDYCRLAVERLPQQAMALEV